MVTEIIAQAAILLLTLAILFAVQYVPKQALTKHRTSNRATTQAHRHLSQATHLLARARSTPQQAQSQALAKSAITETEKALALTPKNPALHLLKSKALDLLGHKKPALRSLELALSSPRARALEGRERAETLVRRAELKLAVNRRRRVDSAVEDLEEALRVTESGEEERAYAFCMLGECYEFKGLREKAKIAFEEALRAEPRSTVARQGLERLSSL